MAGKALQTKLKEIQLKELHTFHESKRSNGPLPLREPWRAISAMSRVIELYDPDLEFNFDLRPLLSRFSFLKASFVLGKSNLEKL